MEMTSRKNCLQITTLLPIYCHYKINSHYQVNNKRLVTNKVRIPGVTMMDVKDNEQVKNWNKTLIKLSLL